MPDHKTHAAEGRDSKSCTTGSPTVDPGCATHHCIEEAELHFPESVMLEDGEVVDEGAEEAACDDR